MQRHKDAVIALTGLIHHLVMVRDKHKQEWAEKENLIHDHELDL